MSGSAGALVDTVDIDVGLRARIDGSIRPIDEREVYAVDAPRGALLTVVAKRRGPGALVPTFDVLRPDEVSTYTSTPAATGAKLKRQEIGESGRHAVRLTGDGANDGDFRLKIKTKPRLKWKSGALAPIAPAGMGAYAFAAPSNATAKIVVKSDVDDGAHAFRVSYPDGSFVDSVPPEPGTRKHVVRDLVLGDSGEYVVQLRNDGAATSTVTVNVVLSVERRARTTLDLRDSADDLLNDNRKRIGRVVDPEDGGVVEPVAGGTDPGEVVVDVPPGAVAEPVVVTLETIERYFVDDDQNAGGPAFEFGPPGQEFAEPVTVTIPFDPNAYDDPDTELSVVVQDPVTGEVEAVPPPYVIDDVAGTVTFQVDHFSQYQSVSPRPRPVAGTFVELSVAHSVTDSFGGSVAVGVARLHGFSDTRTGNTLQLDRSDFSLAWGVVGGPPATATLDEPTSSEFGTADVQDNETVLANFGTGVRAFRRGRSRDIALALDESDVQRPGRTRVIFRRTKRDPTALSLAATWHALVLEFGAATTPQQDVDLRQVVQQATLKISRKGTVVPSAVSRRRSVATLGAEGWTTVSDVRKPPAGQIDPSGPDAVLTMGLGADRRLDTVTLAPVVGGDLLVGRSSVIDAGGSGGAVRLVLLVRAGSRFKPEDLDGDTFLSRLTPTVVDLVNPSTQEVRAGRRVRTRIEQGTFAGGTASILGGRRSTVEHDATGNVVSVLDTTPAASRAYEIRPDGRMKFGVSFEGAVARRRGFAVLASTNEGQYGLLFIVPGKLVVQ